MAKFWTEEEIAIKRTNFIEARNTQKGNYPEFLIRVYCLIAKACSNEDGIRCKASTVRSYKLCKSVYKGLTSVDLDSRSVIDDCFEKLKLMQYIKFVKSDSDWYIYLNKQLDILPGEELDSYYNYYDVREIRYLSK